MILRLFAAMLAWIVVALPSSAEDLADVIPFEHEISRDVAGGYYLLFEDASVSARFSEPGAVVWAEFQIVEPHRTEKFGSGVAFYFLDAQKDRYARVTFISPVEGAVLGMNGSAGQGWLKDDGGESRKLFKSDLSIPKTSGARVSFRNDANQGLVLKVGRTETPLKLGFDPAHVLVQIYCADAWVRFLEQEAIS